MHAKGARETLKGTGPAYATSGKGYAASVHFLSLRTGARYGPEQSFFVLFSEIFS
jgi:hypothetical protein